MFRHGWVEAVTIKAWKQLAYSRLHIEVWRHPVWKGKRHTTTEIYIYNIYLKNNFSTNEWLLLRMKAVLSLISMRKSHQLVNVDFFSRNKHRWHNIYFTSVSVSWTIYLSGSYVRFTPQTNDKLHQLTLKHHVFRHNYTGVCVDWTAGVGFNSVAWFQGLTTAKKKGICNYG